MRLADAGNIADLREAARRRLPRVVFEYVDRGSEDEISARSNRTAFERWRFRPRALVDTSGRSQKVECFGRTWTLPLAIAPTGMAGLCWFDADVALARAAARKGIPFILSSVSTTPMERVAAAGDGERWFQLYLGRDREAGRRLVERARNAGYEALVVTVDSAVHGNREYNAKNGFVIPFRFTRRNFLDGATHPDWAFNTLLRTFVKLGVPRFANLDADGPGTAVASRSVGQAVQPRDTLTWEDLRWLRESWPKRLLLKGVMHPADVPDAIAAGCDGLIVSNHGGRQLDRSMAPIDALPDIVTAAAGRIPVFMDGGVRRGGEIVTALALGAQAVMVGRTTLYGVAAGGEAGVRRALDLLEHEIDQILALIGCPSFADLRTREVLTRYQPPG